MILDEFEERFLDALCKLDSGETERRVTASVVDTDEVLEQCIDAYPDKGIDDLRARLPHALTLLQDSGLLHIKDAILGGRKALVKITGSGIRYCRGDKTALTQVVPAQNILNITNSQVAGAIVTGSPGAILSNIETQLASMDKYSEFVTALSELVRLVEGNADIDDTTKVECLQLIETLTEEARKDAAERSKPIVLKSLLTSVWNFVQAVPSLASAVQPLLRVIAAAIGIAPVGIAGSS